MGQFIGGKWVTSGVKVDSKGEFVRKPTAFRDHIRADGSSPFPAEAGRYHLYVSWACPWAHRTTILRRLKKLQDAISLSVVNNFVGPDGWSFEPGPEVTQDTANGVELLREIYIKARSDYTGRVTVPVLWDKKANTIVNNESREIIAMFDRELDAFGDSSVHFFDDDLRDDIENTIDAIYNPINNGVYRCGFAKSQTAYDKAVAELFDALDHWEDVLARQRYLLGPRITAADWCMFTTLLRFDPVYHGHFKCNRRRIRDYPNLWGYLRDLYQVPGVADTCELDYIRQHYYQSHESINPRRIIAVGPLSDELSEPHGRESLG